MNRTARAEWSTGWTLVLSGTLGGALAAVMTYTIGLFIVPLQQEFGWSRAIISSGMTITAIVLAICAPLVGGLIDSYGSRRIALPGTALFCGSVALLATATGSYLQWWALWVFVAISSLLIAPTIWAVAISSRFDHARGLALAFILSGSGIASVVSPLLGNYLLAQVGWRLTFAGLGLFWFALTFPLVFFFFRSAADVERSRQNLVQNKSITARRPAKVKVGADILSARFLKLASASALMMMIIAGIMVHFVPILTDRGLDRSTAVAAASLIGVGSVCGRLTTGALLDRFNPRVVGSLGFLIPLGAVAALLSFDGSLSHAYGAAVLLGLGAGAEWDISAFLLSRFFSLRAFGTLFGTIVAITALAAGAGPMAAGLIYDRSGSYDLLFWLAIPTITISSFIIAWLGPVPERGEVGASPGDEGVSATSA